MMERPAIVTISFGVRLRSRQEPLGGPEDYNQVTVSDSVVTQGDEILPSNKPIGDAPLLYMAARHRKHFNP